jgi:hypothetical protein
VAVWCSAASLGNGVADPIVFHPHQFQSKVRGVTGVDLLRPKCIGQYRVHIRNGTPHHSRSLAPIREYCVDFVVCGLWRLGAYKMVRVRV